MDNQPTVNLVKAGQGVPVKFSLGGDYGLGIFAAGYPAFQLTACGTAETIDPVEQTVPAGQSSLSFDTATGVYTYVWKTEKAWANQCGPLVLTFTDGSQHSADFHFKK